MAKKKPDYNALIARRQSLKAQIAEQEDELKEIEARLEDLSYGKHELKDFIVTRTPIKKLDTAVFEAEFPADERPELYKLALDNDEIKKHFSANQLDAYKKLSYVRTYVKEK